MALTKTLELSADKVLRIADGDVLVGKEQLTLPDCYIKVESVAGDKNLVSAKVLISAQNIALVRAYEFAPDMEEGNFIKQAYVHLKTLPEFEGAVNC